MSDGLAEWVNPSDFSKGIVARELLPRSEPVFSPTPIDQALPPVEVHGVYFEDPELSAETKAERARLVTQARLATYFGTDKEFQAVNP